MLITGAKGMAKEIFEVLQQQNCSEEIFFYDDVTADMPPALFGCRILRTIDEAAALFTNSNHFVLGLGNPMLRKKMYEKFTAINGRLCGLVSPFASVGKFGTELREGCTVMTGATITNSVRIGRAVLININASISHDCVIGDFAEVSPGAVITGCCNIGAYSIIGANATILPKINIGAHVIVGAGAVVTKDVADNSVVTGVPAKPVHKSV